jgi:hypothetical protein
MYASYFLSTRFLDVTIVVGDKTLPAHRIVLATNHYFNTLLNSSFKEATAPRLELKDISFEHAKLLLAVIYDDASSHIEIDEDPVNEDEIRAKTKKLTDMLAFFHATKHFALGHALIRSDRVAGEYPGLLREFELSMPPEFCDALSFTDIELLFELETEAEHVGLGQHVYARYLALAAKEPKQTSGFHVAYALQHALEHETAPSATKSFMLKLTRYVIPWAHAHHAAGDAAGVAKVIAAMREHVAHANFHHRAAGFVPALMAHDLSACPPLSEFALWLMRLKMLIQPILEGRGKSRPCTYACFDEETKGLEYCGERATLSYGLFSRCAMHVAIELRDPRFFARCAKCSEGLIAMHQVAGSYVCSSCVRPEPTEDVAEIPAAAEQSKEKMRKKTVKALYDKVPKEEDDEDPKEEEDEDENDEEPAVIRTTAPSRKINARSPRRSLDERE